MELSLQPRLLSDPNQHCCLSCSCTPSLSPSWRLGRQFLVNSIWDKMWHHKEGFLTPPNKGISALTLVPLCRVPTVGRVDTTENAWQKGTPHIIRPSHPRHQSTQLEAEGFGKILSKECQRMTWRSLRKSSNTLTRTQETNVKAISRC